MADEIQEIYMRHDSEGHVYFTSNPQAGPSDGAMRLARVVEEADNWRRLYEAKSLECARLQKRVEELEGWV